MLIVVERRETFHYYYPMGVHPPGDLTVTIGAFLSCAFGILFTLLAAPNKALLCLIVYQATQFVENQFIYPHVVGNSVGLSPFWTLLAVLLGGKLFGVLGMIFFIPLMALVSQLLHESIERRLHTRKPELSNVQNNSDENDSPHK